jgi:WhiB family redox-sensing transcriptional regulator
MNDGRRLRDGETGIVPVVDPHRGWQDHGLCRKMDLDAFFPHQGGNALIRAAQAVCNTPCLVKAECREFAMVNKIKFGVWGGLSENQREKLRGGRHEMRDCTVCHVEYLAPRRTISTVCSPECKEQAKVNEWRAYNERQQYSNRRATA